MAGEKGLAEAGSSRLLSRTKPGGAGVVPPRPAVKRNKGFRLDNEALARLRRLVERLEEETGKRISEAALLGGVLYLGEKAETKELVEALMRSQWE